MNINPPTPIGNVQSKMRLDKLLANMGYASRYKPKLYAWLRKNQVSLASNPDQHIESFRIHVDPSDVLINGKRIPFYDPKLSIVLHKPKGYVCSRVREPDNKILYDLLPEEFVRMKKPLLGIAGRLDKFVTGLVVLTRDGYLAQRIISPRRGVAMKKVYEVTGAKPFIGTEQAMFASGELTLRSEKKPLKPARFEVIDKDHNVARVTLYEGRYHQLSRMLGALGNKAKAIHRVQIGVLKLGDLEPGTWRYLTPEEHQALCDKSNEENRSGYDTITPHHMGTIVTDEEVRKHHPEQG